MGRDGRRRFERDLRLGIGVWSWTLELGEQGFRTGLGFNEVVMYTGLGSRQGLCYVHE